MLNSYLELSSESDYGDDGDYEETKTKKKKQAQPKKVTQKKVVEKKVTEKKVTNKKNNSESDGDYDGEEEEDYVCFDFILVPQSHQLTHNS
jgi:hypothetical protein